MLNHCLTAALLAASLSCGYGKPVPEPPRRIVSLAPNLTEMVTMLGAEDRLVAVTPFCRASPAIPRLPGGLLADPETILGFSPDLVLCTPMTPDGTRRQLASLGLHVEVVATPSLGAIRSETQRMAGLLGVKVPPMEVSPTAATGPTAVLLFGADTGYSAARGSHAHEILEAAGLRNIAADAATPWPQLGEEFLLEKDPEILVIADSGKSSREDVMATLRGHPLRSHLRAVRGGHVVILPAEAFTVPGPSALETASKLRAASKSQ